MNWASLVIQMVKNAGDPGSICGPGRPLEKGTATHSSILAWRIPWTEELAGCSPWSHQESDTTEQHFHFFFSIWTSDLRKTNLALRFTSMLRSMRIFYYLRLLNGFKINKGHTVNDGIVYEPCHLARNFSWCQDLSPSTWHQVFQQISQKYQYCFFSRNLELSGRIWLSRWDLNRD